MDEDDVRVSISLDERAVRALHSAVCFTLTKWTGQEKIDQEELQNLRPFLQGAIFECIYQRE
tara:strand:+ start:3749 stop:3934 length:186 start_codon:yes stop_codon:yes gene_type:complete